MMELMTVDQRVLWSKMVPDGPRWSQMVPDGPGRWFPSQSGFTDASMSLGLARLFCGDLEKGGQGLTRVVKPRSFSTKYCPA